VFFFAVLIAQISCFMVKIESGETFCFLVENEFNQTFAGSYVVSGFNEGAVSVLIQEPAFGMGVYSNSMRKEGDWEFVTKRDGEYSCCFNNHAFESNYVSVEINAAKKENNPHVTSDGIEGIGSSLTETFETIKEIQSNQNFQKAREFVHGMNLDLLNSRINWSVFFKVLTLGLIAAGQAFILTGFFKTKSKRIV